MADYDVRNGLYGEFIYLHEPITPGPRRSDNPPVDDVRQNISNNTGQSYTPPTPANPQDDTSRPESPTAATRGTIGAVGAYKYINHQSIYEINPLSDTECELVYGYATEYKVTVNQSAESLAMLIQRRY